MNICGINIINLLNGKYKRSNPCLYFFNFSAITSPFSLPNHYSRACLKNAFCKMCVTIADSFVRMKNAQLCQTNENDIHQSQAQQKYTDRCLVQHFLSFKKCNASFLISQCISQGLHNILKKLSVFSFSFFFKLFQISL